MANQGGYSMAITATESECQAIADRFGLTYLSKLQASVQIRPSSSMMISSSSSSMSGNGSSTSSSSSSSIQDLPVEVEGSIIAHLTQTCVRTNEKFEVDVEFPIYSLVRPICMAHLMGGGGSSSSWLLGDDVIIEPMEGSSTKPKRQGSGTADGTPTNKPIKKKKSEKRTQKQQIKKSRQGLDLKDVAALQAAIEASEEYRTGKNSIGRSTARDSNDDLDDDDNSDEEDDDDGNSSHDSSRSASSRNTFYYEGNTSSSSEAAASSAALVEDESIYSSATGVLDVGELVAQTFWLQLDPYPKKPGTGPMEFTITG
jgi:hypothetical protein